MYRLRIICVVVITYMLITTTHSQSFQPYIGVHGGVNFSVPKVIQNYQIITLLDGTADPLVIEYNSFSQNFGHQLGFSVIIDVSEKLAVGLLPQQARYTYGTTSELEFFDDQGNFVSRTTTTSDNNLNYINIPLVLKYTLREADFSPFLLGGFSYGIMRNAQHNVISETISENPNANLQIPTTSSDNYSNEYIKSKLNVYAGAGVAYDFTQFKIEFDATYWIGLNNIVSETNRYSNETISGSSYNVPADLKLDHLALNVSVLFPINKVNDRGSLDCVPSKKRR